VRAGLAVREFLVAFAVVVALAMLLIPGTPPRCQSAPAESRPPSRRTALQPEHKCFPDA
jgi:hypothetical protein